MSDTFWGGYSNALGALGQVQSQITNRRVGARLAQNDYRGAANTLFQSGDLQGGSALTGVADQRQAADAERQLAFTIQATRALRRTQLEGGDVLAAYDQYAPAFQQMGATPEQVQQLRGQLQQNPEGFLDSIDNIVGQQQRALRYEKSGDTLHVFEEGNPDPIRSFEAPRRPVVVNGVLADPVTGQTILDARDPRYQTVQNSDGTTSVVAIDQPAPVSTVNEPRPTTGVNPVSVISELIPGVRFNSGLRTPEQNRAARGAENSYHLSGNAVDIPPQRGRDIAQFRRELEARGVNVRELIDEGDHWHIAWEGGTTAPNFGNGAPQPSPVSPSRTRVVASGANNGPSPAQSREDERLSRQERMDQNALRREFNGRQEVKDYRTVQSAYDSVRAAARNPSAAGDLSLIFNYMKLLDPGSVVREQEFANAQNAAGVPDQIRNLYNRALNGERLNPRQRQDFVSQAENLFQTRTTTYNRVADEYRREAELSGFDPSRIVPGSGGNQPRTNAPGLPFNINETQLAYRNRLAQNGASASAPLGSARNPYYTNPQDERSGLSNYQRRANESGRDVIVITSRGPAILRPSRGAR